MTLAALRRSVVYLRADHASIVEVRGRGAFAALDRALPSDLFLHDGQARPSLLLDDAGSGAVAADVLVAKLEDRFVLVVDGATADDVVARVRGAGAHDADAVDAREAWVLVSLHGPYAWELASAWTGRRVGGLPPLGLLRTDRGVVVRGGKTGEYGYEVLVPRAELEPALARLEDLGRAFDLEAIATAALDAAVLENGGWARRLVGPGLTPFELQLQWRLSPTKSRAAPAARRLVWWRAAAAPAPAAAVTDPETGAAVGVIRAAVTGSDGEPIGVALLDLPFAHPGFEFATASGPLVTTASPPLVRATSLGVQPDVHSYVLKSHPA